MYSALPSVFVGTPDGGLYCSICDEHITKRAFDEGWRLHELTKDHQMRLWQSGKTQQVEHPAMRGAGWHSAPIHGPTVTPTPSIPTSYSGSQFGGTRASAPTGKPPTGGMSFKMHPRFGLCEITEVPLHEIAAQRFVRCTLCGKDMAGDFGGLMWNLHVQGAQHQKHLQSTMRGEPVWESSDTTPFVSTAGAKSTYCPVCNISVSGPTEGPCWQLHESGKQHQKNLTNSRAPSEMGDAVSISSLPASQQRSVPTAFPWHAYFHPELLRMQSEGRVLLGFPHEIIEPPITPTLARCPVCGGQFSRLNIEDFHLHRGGRHHQRYAKLLPAELGGSDGGSVQGESFCEAQAHPLSGLPNLGGMPISGAPSVASEDMHQRVAPSTLPWQSYFHPEVLKEQAEGRLLPGLPADVIAPPISPTLARCPVCGGQFNRLNIEEFHHHRGGRHHQRYLKFLPAYLRGLEGEMQPEPFPAVLARPPGVLPSPAVVPLPPRSSATFTSTEYAPGQGGGAGLWSPDPTSGDPNVIRCLVCGKQVTGSYGSISWQLHAGGKFHQQRLKLRGLPTPLSSELPTPVCTSIRVAPSVPAAPVAPTVPTAFPSSTPALWSEPPKDTADPAFFAQLPRLVVPGDEPHLTVVTLCFHPSQTTPSDVGRVAERLGADILGLQEVDIKLRESVTEQLQRLPQQYGVQFENSSGPRCSGIAYDARKLRCHPEVKYLNLEAALQKRLKNDIEISDAEVRLLGAQKKGAIACILDDRIMGKVHVAVSFSLPPGIVHRQLRCFCFAEIYSWAAELARAAHTSSLFLLGGLNSNPVSATYRYATLWSHPHTEMRPPEVCSITSQHRCSDFKHVAHLRVNPVGINSCHTLRAVWIPRHPTGAAIPWELHVSTLTNSVKCGESLALKGVEVEEDGAARIKFNLAVPYVFSDPFREFIFSWGDIADDAGGGAKEFCSQMRFEFTSFGPRTPSDDFNSKLRLRSAYERYREAAVPEQLSQADAASCFMAVPDPGAPPHVEPESAKYVPVSEGFPPTLHEPFFTMREVLSERGSTAAETRDFIFYNDSTWEVTQLAKLPAFPDVPNEFHLPLAARLRIHRSV